MDEENKLSTIIPELSSKLKNNSKVGALLSLDTKYVDRTLAIVLLLLIGVLMWETKNYTWENQRAPVFIGGILLLLLVIELLGQFDIVDVESKLRTERTFGSSDAVADKVDSTMEEDEGLSLFDRRKELIFSIFWIIFILVDVIIFGLLLGGLIFLLLYFYFEADLGIKRTLVYSVAIWLFLWLVFEYALEARLYPGIYDIGVFFYN